MAYSRVLVAESPKGSIAGVYLKGSSQRLWKTEIDYVPELSDVDIHVRLAPDAPAVLHSFPFALQLAQSALAAFQHQFPSRSHTPRPQLSFLDHLETLPGYLASPAGTVQTLLGEDYRGGTRAEYADCAQSDAQRFSSDTHFLIDELAGKVIDRPGKLLWHVVSTITWRVGPAGPRLLTHLGMDPYTAWSLNRTAIVRELHERGQETLANSYAEFYVAGWEGFRSGFKADAAARRALSAAHRLYTGGLALIE